MSTSPFMDDYSSEDYSDHDHDDDYYFVPTATSPPQVRGQVEIQTQSNELQNLIIDHQEDVSQSVYFDLLPELEVETAEEEGRMEQSIYLAVESYFDLEAQAETGGAAEAETTVEELVVGSYFDLEVQVETGVAAVLEAETTVEELAVGSYFELEQQVETGVGAALDTKTVLEEGDVIESESLETVEADTVVETVERMIEEFIYEAVESESDLEAEEAIEEPNSDVEHEADAVAPEAETAVGEEDVIEEFLQTVAADAALTPDTGVEEGDVLGKPIEAVESDYDLEAETEAEDMVEEEGDVVEEEEDMVEEEDDVVEEEDVVVEEEEYMVEEEDDVVEEEDDVVEEEDDMVEEEDDFVEEEDDMVEEEHDVIDVPLESDNNLQAEAEALVEGAAVEESIFEPLESNSDPEGEEPEALAEPVVSIEMTTFKAQEPDSDLEPEDLIDEQSDACEEEWDSDVEESDLNEKEWDSDAEESDMDPEDSDMDSSDSDLTEEEEDDVVVSYLQSSTTIRNKAWENLVPASALAWAKLQVTDTSTLEDSSLVESFLGCGPMLMLQECGNAVMNVIGTLLRELSRIRNNLRRVLGALFRKRETTKHM